MGNNKKWYEIKRNDGRAWQRPRSSKRFPDMWYMHLQYLKIKKQNWRNSKTDVNRCYVYNEKPLTYDLQYGYCSYPFPYISRDVVQSDWLQGSVNNLDKCILVVSLQVVDQIHPARPVHIFLQKEYFYLAKKWFTKGNFTKRNKKKVKHEKIKTIHCNPLDKWSEKWNRKETYQILFEL